MSEITFCPATQMDFLGLTLSGLGTRQMCKIAVKNVIVLTSFCVCNLNLAFSLTYKVLCYTFMAGYPIWDFQSHVLYNKNFYSSDAEGVFHFSNQKAVSDISTVYIV